MLYTCCKYLLKEGGMRQACRVVTRACLQQALHKWEIWGFVHDVILVRIFERTCLGFTEGVREESAFRSFMGVTFFVKKKNKTHQWNIRPPSSYAECGYDVKMVAQSDRDQDPKLYVKRGVEWYGGTSLQILF